MTEATVLVLAGPVIAALAMLATGIFVMRRVLRYGRVFNWPKEPQPSTTPTPR